ncbi:MAG: glycosyltransferase family 4 protein [Pseudomonadota bacterium]
MKILVIQNGARHNYAIPLGFARAGVLSQTYTDFAVPSGIADKLKQLKVVNSASHSALLRRTPPSIVAESMATTSFTFALAQVLKKIARASGKKYDADNIARKLIERAMSAKGVGKATHVYTMLGEGGALVHAAQEMGLKIIGDVYIALSADDIVAKEVQKFPDWVDEKTLQAARAEQTRSNKTLLDCSDLLICPSEFVRDDLVEHHGVAEARTRVVPYAVDSKWWELETKPEVARVLFAGSATLRKGVHYLAKAATILGHPYKFRVAGGVSHEVRRHPDSKDLTFLGHLGQRKMAHEFALADVLAFPSLAEGSASVTAEALGAGVPVVTTKSAGSIVRDGVDGIIVPERDPEALANAVRSIVEDRDKREAMSKEARRRAQTFTWENFISNVVGLAKEIQEPEGK